MIGLPASITTCLFDLDGVLTDTASVHMTAWKRTFDPILGQHSQGEFSERDYDDYVDGKPREDGVRDFFAARHIELSASDIATVADRKNALVQELIEKDGVKVFPGSWEYVKAAQQAGLHRIVVSSSANTAQVLRVTGLDAYVEGRVDGNTLKEQHLAGKPAPDSFLAGARLAGVTADVAVVFEDATAGVQAGRAGHFGYVVGVNRIDDEHRQALTDHGASVVVNDLSELL